MEFSAESFKEKLDAVHTFPTLYVYKFIVTKEKMDEIKKLFPKHDIKKNPSRNGKYISCTIQVMAASSDEIVETYTEAKKIEGIISL